MSISRQKDKPEQITKFGFPVYETNPSVTNEIPTRVKKTDRGQSSNFSMITPDTGELVANGALCFVEEREVDTEEFVKFYENGIKQMHKLTKPGTELFMYVYHEIIGKKSVNKDTIALNAYHIQKWKPDMSARTYNRGLHELLEKKFLFRSITRDVFFINVRYLFNGDRMGLVKLYRRRVNKNAMPLLTDNQKPLDLYSDSEN